MNALQVVHYVGRAEDFYRGLELIRGDEEYRCSSALLAIHSEAIPRESVETSR
jgi:hypothetical protein